MSRTDAPQTVGLLHLSISRTNMSAMNTFRAIRESLGVTQAEMGAALGVSQGNVSFYEKGQTVPPTVAAKLIEFARSKGKLLSYDDIYRVETSAPSVECVDAPLACPEAHLLCVIGDADVLAANAAIASVERPLSELRERRDKERRG